MIIFRKRFILLKKKIGVAIVKKSNKKFQKLMVGICTVTLGTTIVPGMNGLSLNVVSA